MKRVKTIQHAFAVNKSIGKIITDRYIDRLEIINESFFDEALSFMSPSRKLIILIDYEYKYQ
jgi:hypothetical protein